ncbi:hypothetical protein NDU88_005965 [Pleurodeles waltl]|uniref:Uncharacterized protein n=1 Tax=Pleurodeles waltl TaxID=8319 RepID=A0AAV7PGY2_PLEWA|nr:hypothetical protein NDU88_005965 [Pleurodeles waltl]
MVGGAGYATALPLSCPQGCRMPKRLLFVPSTGASCGDGPADVRAPGGVALKGRQRRRGEPRARFEDAAVAPSVGALGEIQGRGHFPQRDLDLLGHGTRGERWAWRCSQGMRPAMRHTWA